MKTIKKITTINQQYKNNLEDYSNSVFVLNITKNTKIFWIILKKLFTFTIFFAFFIAFIFGIFIGVKASLTSQSNFLKETDGDIVVEIIKGILMALYIVFVPAINWILSLIQNLIYILSFYPLINGILDTSVTIFLKWTAISFIILGAIFAAFKLFKIFYERNGNTIEKEKNFFFSNIFKAILLVFTIPFIIIFLNTLVIYLVTIIFELSNPQETDLALIIFNNSFYDYAHDYAQIPNKPTAEELSNFSFLVFMISTIILTVLLANVVLDLAVRIYEVIVLLFVSPLVISISISDDATRFKYWVKVMNQKIFSVVFIVGTYVLFISLIPFITNFAFNYLDSFDNLVQQGFIIVMILAGAFMLESSKTLVSFIFAENTNVGFATTISNITNRTNYYKGSILTGFRAASLPYTYGYNGAKNSIKPKSIKDMGFQESE